MNNPDRAESDWHDIRLLVRAAREQGTVLDWELLADYLQIFQLEGRLSELRGIHGQAD